jgi:hypothetical protein
VHGVRHRRVLWQQQPADVHGLRARKVQ